jgi:hypothetical protein
MAIDFTSLNVAEKLAAWESNSIVGPTSLVQRVEDRRNRKSDGIPTPWKKLEGDFELRPAELVMLGGYSGHFKSSISAQMSLQALAMGKTVGIASLELPAEDLVELYSELAFGNTEPPMNYVSRFAQWAEGKLHIYDRVDAIKPEDAVALTYHMAVNQGCDLIILDALMMMGVCDDLERERKFTQMLATIAKRFNVCILLVHHMRKPSGLHGEEKPPGKYDFVGSGHLVNIAMSVVIVWHDKAKAGQKAVGAHYDDNQPDLVIHIAKQRNHRFEGRVGLWQHDTCRAFCSTSQRHLAKLDLMRERAA